MAQVFANRLTHRDQPTPDEFDARSEISMKISRGFRRLQFSIWTLFVATTLVCLYLGAAPRIQDARSMAAFTASL